MRPIANPCDEYMTRRRYLTIQALLSGQDPAALIAAEEPARLGERRTWERWEGSIPVPSGPSPREVARPAGARRRT